MLFDGFCRHMSPHQVREAVLTHGADDVVQRAGVKNLVALLVDHLALVVGDVIVLEQLFAHVEVARLYLALGRFDAARDDACLDGFAVRHLEPIHDGLDAVACKNAHQRVVQAQVET